VVLVVLALALLVAAPLYWWAPSDAVLNGETPR